MIKKTLLIIYFLTTIITPFQFMDVEANLGPQEYGPYNSLSITETEFSEIPNSDGVFSSITETEKINESQNRGELFHAERVSVSSDGTEANDISTNSLGSIFPPSISTDGRYIAFSSSATNLIENDINGNAWDVFVHDRSTGTTEVISISSLGYQGNQDSWGPSISGDGRYIVFCSTANNLIENDNNGFSDIFLYDRISRTTSIISVSSTGSQGTHDSQYPIISQDGKFIAFESYANNLVENDPDRIVYTVNEKDIFLYERETATLEIITTNLYGLSHNGQVNLSSLSSDGQYIVFNSTATDFIENDLNSAEMDVFVFDRETSTTKIVSIDSYGNQSSQSSYADFNSQAISSDGQYIVFKSNNLMTNDLNASSDIYIHNQFAGSTEIVSVDSNGEQFYNAYNPSISNDGRYVTFIADNEYSDYLLFWRDQISGTTQMISNAYNGSYPDGGLENQSISGNGSFVVFNSYSTNLTENDTNDDCDTFIIDLFNYQPHPTWLLMYYMAGDNNLADIFQPMINEDLFSANNPNIEIAVFQDLPGLPSHYRFLSSSGEINYYGLGNNINSGDPQTLIDFVNWSKAKTSATYNALIISDHGHALGGVAKDETSDDKIVVKDELPQALSSAGPFDILYMSACLMGNIEFMYQIRGVADFYVAHESTMWFPIVHSFYLQNINEMTTPRVLSLAMAYYYFLFHYDYDYLKNGEYTMPSTVSVADMSQLNLVVEKTNGFALAIRNAPLETKFEIWLTISTPPSVLQRYEENGVPGITLADKLVDLYDLAELIRVYPEIQTAADALLETKDSFIIFNEFWSGFDGDSYWDHENSNGVTITLPMNPISFYGGDWLEFAEGTDWTFIFPAKDQESARTSPMEWGPMVSDLVMLYNPDGTDQPFPPNPIEPGIGEYPFYDIYLPLIIR